MSFQIERGKEVLRLEARRIDVGTHSSCQLVLDDPVAADHHCTLALGSRGLQLVPSETSTGTYVDGAACAEPTWLEVGARIVLGTTRITVTAADARGATLAVAERAFFFTPKKRGEFHSDADQWVRSEVRFGRIRPLRWLNAAALLVAAALAAGAALGARPLGLGAALTAPGPLSRVHAALACNDCHAHGAADLARQCGACHEGLAAGLVPLAEGGRHPFTAGADCRSCHREHRGGPRPVDPARTAGKVCADCHAEDVVAPPTVAVVAAPAARPPSRGLEGFRHAAHAAVDCARCHVPAGGGDEGDDGRYTVPASFEACASCHAEGGAEAAHAAPRRVALTAAQHDTALDVCAACHAAPAGALRTVSLARSAGTYEVLPRSHAEWFAGSHAAGRACDECHLAPPTGPAARAAAPFAHALHLDAALAPGSAAQDAQCAECHADVARAAGLAAPAPEAAPLDACATRCHGVGGGGQPPVRRVAGPPDVLAEHVEFSHAGHAAVPGGCAACHVGPDGAVLRPEPGGRACAACHVGPGADGRAAHRAHPGVEACQACHGAIGADTAAGVWSPASAAQPTPARTRSDFSHAEGGHRETACVVCHAPDARSGGMALPDASGATCRGCHTRLMFHWW